MEDGDNSYVRALRQPIPAVVSVESRPFDEQPPAGRGRVVAAEADDDDGLSGITSHGCSVSMASSRGPSLPATPRSPRPNATAGGDGKRSSPRGSAPSDELLVRDGGGDEGDGARGGISAAPGSRLRSGIWDARRSPGGETSVAGRGGGRLPCGGGGSAGGGPPSGGGGPGRSRSRSGGEFGASAGSGSRSDRSVTRSATKSATKSAAKSKSSGELSISLILGSDGRDGRSRSRSRPRTPASTSAANSEPKSGAAGNADISVFSIQESRSRSSGKLSNEEARAAYQRICGCQTKYDPTVSTSSKECVGGRGDPPLAALSPSPPASAPSRAGAASKTGRAATPTSLSSRVTEDTRATQETIKSASASGRSRSHGTAYSAAGTMRGTVARGGEENEDPDERGEQRLEGVAARRDPAETTKGPGPEVSEPGPEAPSRPREYRDEGGNHIVLATLVPDTPGVESTPEEDARQRGSPRESPKEPSQDPPQALQEQPQAQEKEELPWEQEKNDLPEPATERKMGDGTTMTFIAPIPVATSSLSESNDHVRDKTRGKGSQRQHSYRGKLSFARLKSKRSMFFGKSIRKSKKSGVDPAIENQVPEVHVVKTLRDESQAASGPPDEASLAPKDGKGEEAPMGDEDVGGNTGDGQQEGTNPDSGRGSPGGDGRWASKGGGDDVPEAPDGGKKEDADDRGGALPRVRSKCGSARSRGTQATDRTAGTGGTEDVTDDGSGVGGVPAADGGVEATGEIKKEGMESLLSADDYDGASLKTRRNNIGCNTAPACASSPAVSPTAPGKELAEDDGRGQGLFGRLFACGAFRCDYDDPAEAGAVEVQVWKAPSTQEGTVDGREAGTGFGRQSSKAEPNTNSGIQSSVPEVDEVDPALGIELFDDNGGVTRIGYFTEEECLAEEEAPQGQEQAPRGSDGDAAKHDGQRGGPVDLDGDISYSMDNAGKCGTKVTSKVILKSKVKPGFEVRQGADGDDVVVDSVSAKIEDIAHKLERRRNKAADRGGGRGGGMRKKLFSRRFGRKAKKDSNVLDQLEVKHNVEAPTTALPQKDVGAKKKKKRKSRRASKVAAAAAAAASLKHNAKCPGDVEKIGEDESYDDLDEPFEGLD